LIGLGLCVLDVGAVMFAWLTTPRQSGLIVLGGALCIGFSPFQFYAAMASPLWCPPKQVCDEDNKHSPQSHRETVSQQLTVFYGLLPMNIPIGAVPLYPEFIIAMGERNSSNGHDPLVIPKDWIAETNSEAAVSSWPFDVGAVPINIPRTAAPPPMAWPRWTVHPAVVRQFSNTPLIVAISGVSPQTTTSTAHAALFQMLAEADKDDLEFFVWDRKRRRAWQSRLAALNGLAGNQPNRPDHAFNAVGCCIVGGHYGQECTGQEV
jgi:hypothetical protein